MERIFEILFKLLPLIFAFGFLVPVFNQGLLALNWLPPFGLSTLAVAFIVACPWGLIATMRGRWI